MEQTEFDHVADTYYEQHREAVQITGEEPEYFAEYKIRVLAELAAAGGIGPRRVLDFGSGIGNSIPHFRKHLPSAQLTCADVSRRSLDLAERRFAGMAESLLIEGERIPAEDAGFDLAFSACVFHHIDHDEHVHWLRELCRVTHPGGLLAIFEHNPLNPLTVRAVNNCPFDENAELIRSGQLAQRFEAAGWKRPRVRYHLFLPRAFAALRPLERALTSVPFGAQYSVVARKPA
jgi:ubiquinone/menaquinone biosynthesis C-methylase UbiE